MTKNWANQSLKSIVANFLGNHWSAEHEKEIEEIQMNFRLLGEGVSVQLHFLRSHLDYFPKNSGDLSKEQDGHFYHDIRIMKDYYQDRWDVNFSPDYCWCLKRDAVIAEQRKKYLKRSFIHEYLLLCIFRYIMAQYGLSTNISAVNLRLFVLFNKKINSYNSVLYILRACILKKLI